MGGRGGGIWGGVRLTLAPAGPGAPASPGTPWGWHGGYGVARRRVGGRPAVGGRTAVGGRMAVGHSPARRVCPPLRGAQRDRADPAGGERREVGAGIWDAKGGGAAVAPLSPRGVVPSPGSRALRRDPAHLSLQRDPAGEMGGRGVSEGGSGGGGAPVASVVRGEGGYGYSQWGRGDPEHRLHRPYRQHPAGGGGLRALRAPLGAGSAWG